MYDGGNELHIKVGSSSATVSYTNTDAYTSAGIGDVQYYTYKQTLSHGQLTAFVAEFASASSAITGFQITGNNGADGYGSQAYGTHDSSTWTGLQNGWHGAFKQVYSAYADPSINHLVMAKSSISQAIHPIDPIYTPPTTDSDFHDLAFSSGVSKVVYVLWAGTSGYHYSDSFFQSVAEALSSTCAQYIEYDFSGGIDFSGTASPGWSTGGDDPASAGTVGPYAFLKNEGGTTSVATGPSNGVGGSGSSYVYAEVTSPRQPGDLYTLAYDGSACGGSVSTVTFHYHMYGATMGELRMSNAAEEVVWSLSGDQGNSWQEATVNVNSASFAFEYERGSSFTGDAAVAQVTVRCG
jgi:hypothetical protein